MNFKFATVTLPNGEDRITFSREEILAMKNSIKDDDPEMRALNMFLAKMEEEILRH